MNYQKDLTVKKELQLCPNLDLDLKPQKALRQRIRAFKQRQVEDLMNQYRKGQKSGADGSGKAGSAEPEEDAIEMPKKQQEESKAAEVNKKEKSQQIEADLASQRGKLMNY